MQARTWIRHLLLILAMATPNIGLAERASLRSESAPSSATAPTTSTPSARSAPRILHALGVTTQQEWLDAKDYGYGADLQYRLRFPSEYQLGLEAAVVQAEADRIGGYAAADTRRLE